MIVNRRRLILTTLRHTSFLASGGICLSCARLLRDPPTARSPGDSEKEASQDAYEDFGIPEPAVSSQELASTARGCQDREPALPTDAGPQEANASPQPTRSKMSNYDKYKLRHFDQNHPGDLFIPEGKRKVLHSSFQKLTAIMNYVGHGHFNLLSFDQMIRYSNRVPGHQKLSQEELSFFEEIFYFDAQRYGFYGKKINKTLTEAVPAHKVVKIAGSGHYLHLDHSLPVYNKIIKEIGQTLILTSGIRGIVKQMQLFLGKTVSVKGNLSQASRSLAPPGHSYHAIGDFDIGKRGLGSFNFTSKFSETEEYKKLIDLGYIDIRYPTDNPFGVRFEPWHIEGTGRT